MISIIDYGAGNLNSVEKAVRFLGFECTVTGDKDEILSSDKLILPGVGAFEDAMKHLQIPDFTGRFMTLWRKRFPF